MVRSAVRKPIFCYLQEIMKVSEQNQCLMFGHTFYLCTCSKFENFGISGEVASAHTNSFKRKGLCLGDFGV